jgi:hypothetical protein
MLNTEPKPATALPTGLPAGARYCPGCAKVYGPEHRDDYCICGIELVKELPAPERGAEIPMAAIMDEVPMAPILDDEPIAEEGVRTEITATRSKPPSGTPCLVLYGPDKRPLHYFALDKDVTMIGRLDAVAGSFPEVDLDEWFDRATIRKISRQHALILRSRATGTFVLRPLVGNTGTQLETQMLTPTHDYPLRPGHRMILGGLIRLKFEIA